MHGRQETYLYSIISGACTAEAKFKECAGSSVAMVQAAALVKSSIWQHNSGKATDRFASGQQGVAITGLYPAYNRLITGLLGDGPIAALDRRGGQERGARPGSVPGPTGMMQERTGNAALSILDARPTDDKFTVRAQFAVSPR